MTNNIDETEKQINLIIDKINIAKSIINTVQYYTNINNNNHSIEMLNEIINHCKELKEGL